MEKLRYLFVSDDGDILVKNGDNVVIDGATYQLIDTRKLGDIPVDFVTMRLVSLPIGNNTMIKSHHGEGIYIGDVVTYIDGDIFGAVIGESIIDVIIKLKR